LQRIGIIINPTSGKGNGKVHGEAAKQAFIDAGVEVIDLSANDFETARANGRKAIAENNWMGWWLPVATAWLTWVPTSVPARTCRWA